MTSLPRKVSSPICDRSLITGCQCTWLQPEQEKNSYRKDTEPLYHSFIYSVVSLLSSIYSLPAMHSLLVTFCDRI